MKDERGQSMILIALAIVGLIAVIGLALDGGRLHTNRRLAQNAADAAALAGAQLLLYGACDGGPSDAAIRDAIIKYISQNGVPVDPGNPAANINAWYVNGYEQRLQGVGLGSVPADARGVEVETWYSEDTTFMRVVGTDDMETGGAAMALVGPIIQLPGGMPILPVAVPDDVVVGMPSGTEFEVENDVFCKVYDGQCIGDPGDASSMRGWLNFDYIYNIEHYTQHDPLRRTLKATTNANDIRRYITGEIPTPPIFLGTQPEPLPPDPPVTVYIDGDFIHGEPGQKQTANHAIFDHWAGETVFLPVFDVVYAPNYLDDNDDQFPDPYVDSGQTWPNQNQYMYHIVGFAAAKVCDPAIDTTCQGNPHDLVGTFEEYITSGQIDPTKPIPCDATLKSAVLWK
ncbi:MAG: pilus assembly protein TadG-related protein [Anaerolineales bacterium]